MELVQIKEEREELIKKLKILEALYQKLCEDHQVLIKKLTRYEKLMQKGLLK